MGKLFGISEIKTLEDWQNIVGKDKFKKGFSAYELAYSWLHKPGHFPESIQKIFNASDYQIFNDLVLNYAIVENPIFLDNFKGPSMNDLMVFAGSKRIKSSIVIAVEGKVNESFDKYIFEWIRDNSENPKKSRKNRLQYLNEQLGTCLTEESKIRYQLVHRTASAIIEAKKNGIDNAMLLIHSFKSKNKSKSKCNFKDYNDFITLFGITNAEKQKIYQYKLGEFQNFFFLWFEDSKS